MTGSGVNEAKAGCPDCGEFLGAAFLVAAVIGSGRGNGGDTAFSIADTESGWTAEDGDQGNGPRELNLLTERFAVLFPCYDHFSSGVARFHEPDGVRDFSQLVALVDYWSYFSGGNEFAHDGQVDLVQFHENT